MKKFVLILILLISLIIPINSVNAIDFDLLEGQKEKAGPAVLIADIYVDDDNTDGPWIGTIKKPFNTINQALDAANSNETIFVFTGTYNETLFIEKEIKLIGQNKESTIINGEYSGNVVRINSSYVEIKAFTIINSIFDWFSAGIKACGVNFLDEKKQDIFLSNIKIENCILKNNDCGIKFSLVKNSYAKDNEIISNKGNGIYIMYSENIEIKDSTIVNNGLETDGDGIEFFGFYNEICKSIDINNCNIKENKHDGISLVSFCKDITIQDNQIINNENSGINIISNVNESYIIKVERNTIKQNGRGGLLQGGIYLQDSKTQLKIVLNEIVDNDKFGVLLTRSSNVQIKKNNFIDNTKNSFFYYKNTISENIWDYNFWDRPRYLPKAIHGYIYNNNGQYLPWLEYDFHPTKEPYFI